MNKKFVATFGALMVSATLTAPLTAHADDSAVNVQIVDALQKRYGVHPGFRANHAKGVVLTGTFKASGAGTAITTSPLFARGPALPVTVRFSDAGGMPATADASALANPHGMSMKFQLPGGGETDIVVNALKFFTVATPEDFRDLQLAAADSPPGSTAPTKLQSFLEVHPSVEQANATLGVPDSFAHEVFYGVDAFVFIDRAGTRQPFRYIIEPMRIVHVTKAEAAAEPPNFLFDELPGRLAQGPVRFHIEAQLADPGDQTKDPTKAWPDTRRVVDLGVLTIVKTVADSDAAQRKLLFLPGRLTVGIEPSDDPLIAARDGSYGVSFGRRNSAP